MILPGSFEQPWILTQVLRPDSFSGIQRYSAPEDVAGLTIT
jgi:hypothetical protein